MFGFLEEDGYLLGDSDKLGSVGRFYKRIDKFRERNSLEKDQYEANLGMRNHILKCRENGDSTGTSVKGWDKKFLKDTENMKKPPMRIHPVIEHHFWWLLHNNIAHTLIGLIPIKWFFDFHDWTSKKLNAL